MYYFYGGPRLFDDKLFHRDVSRIVSNNWRAKWNFFFFFLSKSNLFEMKEFSVHMAFFFFFFKQWIRGVFI